VAPDVDAVDPVDAGALAEVMYPHIEQAAEVCVEEASRLLIEGFELAPSYPVRLWAALGDTQIRACFPGRASFWAADLAGYRGPKPQSESDLSPGELRDAASWIRQRRGSYVSSAAPCACRTSTLGRRASGSGSRPVA
jgi:hypothetical protein